MVAAPSLAPLAEEALSEWSSYMPGLLNLISDETGHVQGGMAVH